MGSMTVEEIILQFQNIGHDEMDCWGVVERWYKMRLGISLEDRGGISPGPQGLAKGFTDKTDWFRVDQPQNNDLVIMSTVIDRQRIAAGHVGVYWCERVLHSDKGIGCVFQSIYSRQIKHRITSFLRHETAI